MMGDKKALQSGTSHFLGQNFSKAFGTQFLDQDNELKHVWQTSWGVSTRMVGAVVMVHGDDQGLILPPRLAPIQVVIVPIWKNDEERQAVLAAAAAVRDELGATFRVKLDEREGLSPGFKFNDWEMRARAFRDANIRPAADWSELAAAVEQGFARAHWCGDEGCEARLKEIQASIRCIPFDQPGTSGRCALCGQEAREVAIVGRAY